MRFYITFLAVCVTLCVALPDHNKKNHESRHYQVKHQEGRHQKRQGEGPSSSSEQPTSTTSDTTEIFIPKCPDYCPCFCGESNDGNNQGVTEGNADNGGTEPTQDTPVDPTPETSPSPNPNADKRHSSKKIHGNSKKHSILHATRQHNNKRHHAKKHHQVRDNGPHTYLPPAEATTETTLIPGNADAETTQQSQDICRTCYCDCETKNTADDGTSDPSIGDEPTEGNNPTVTDQPAPAEVQEVDPAKKRHAARHHATRHHQNKKHNNEKKHHKEAEKHAH